MLSLSSNIWKYAIMLIANKRVFIAILGAYYLTVPGVGPEAIGIILLWSSLSGFVFEIPSGYMADKLGHKFTLILARVLMIASTMFFLFSDSLFFLICGGVFLSLSIAFSSGTGTAFMHETFRGLGREKDYTRVMGKVSAIGFAVPIVFMVLTPFLVGISYKAPFLVALAIDVIGLIAALSLVVPPVIPEHVDEIANTKFIDVFREGYRLGYFPYAIFFGLTTGVLFAVGGFRAAYQSFLELPVIYFGIFFGVGRALASWMLVYSDKLKELLSVRLFYGLELGVYTLLFLSLSLFQSPGIIVTIFIIMNALQWGLSQVNTGHMLDIISKSKFKATLLSMRSQADEVVSAVVGYGLGLAIGLFSYRTGFFFLACTYLLLGLPLYLYIVRKENPRPTARPVEV